MEKEEAKNNSPFKSMLQEDVDIFLNIEEMGETITIEDKEYIGVVEHTDKDFSEEVIDDTYYSVDLILHLKAEEFILKKRNPGKRIIVNGTKYLVNDWYTEEGITTIKLKENTGF